jgi:hypothetical protein
MPFSNFLLCDFEVNLKQVHDQILSFYSNHMHSLTYVGELIKKCP